MKELSLRQFLILKTLKENGKSMSSNNLCTLLNISPRTLRYEIKEINDIANNKVIESDKNGYQIKKKKDLYSTFKSLKINDYLDTTKKVTLMLLEKNILSIYDIADSCFISESTVSNIIKQLSSKFSTFELKIKKKGEFVYVEGNEQSKRKMLSHFFFAEVDSLALQLNNFNDFFTSFDLVDINNMVNEALQEIDINIDTIYFKNIVISLAVALQRIINGCFIEEKDSFIVSHKKSEYFFLKSFMSKAEKNFSIKMDENEFSYILSVIAGSFRNNNQNNTSLIVDDLDFRNKIRSIISNTFLHYGLNYNFDEYFEKICLHIHYLLLRSQNNAFFESEKAFSLKYSHPYIYDIAVYLTYLLENEFNCTINDDEIDLIAIYVGSIVTRTSSYGKIEVVLICPKYNEIRKLLINQLKERFPTQIEIKAIFETYSEIPNNLTYDFIITIIKSEYILSDAIYVSPLLTPREIRSLENKMKEMVNQKKALEMKHQMTKFFDSQLFFYDYPLTKAEDILSFINQKMVELDYVPNDFLKSVYKRESLATSAFFNRFSVPHALDVHSKETKIAYYYSSKPIDWFGEKVNLVLLLASKEYDENFTHIYNTLIDILLDNDLFNKLITCKTYDELLDYVSTNM
ncbi:MAG: BglG family transcription antiterminator [Traorella sp.]